MSCIVGLRHLDSGDLTVFGRSRNGHLGHLCGYMPQDISLLSVLTIGEVLHHFGLIYGMSEVAIENKVNFLTNFLDLPDTSRQIQYLSGGQKRRVSLAACMIHNPNLLVLDEPTVGLDPLLRQRIWQHLFEISRSGTTIILSTHYVEESKRCDKVGFMRGGKLLAEDAPAALLSRYDAPTLEDVSLHLARLDDENPQTYAPPDIVNTKWLDFTLGDEESGVVRAKVYRKLSISLHDNVVHSPVNVETDHASIIYALALKAWRRRKRDWRFLFSEIILPIIILFVLQNVVGLEPRDIPVSLVTGNPNVTNNAELIEFCGQRDRPITYTKCFENMGICDFIRTFEPHEFDWVTTNSFESGLQDIYDGNTFAVLAFPPNYAFHMKNRIIERNFVDNETISGTTISIRMDESNVIKTSWMKQIIATKYAKYLNKIGAACGGDYNSDIVKPAIGYTAIYGGLGIESIIIFSQPAMLITTMVFLSQISGLEWILDRMEGLEDRDYAAGVTLRHRICASMMTDSIKIVVQLTVFIGLLTTVYGMEVHGAWVLALGIVFMAAFEGVAIGWMIGTLRDSALEAIVIIMFVSIFQAAATGVFFSLEVTLDYYRNYFCNWLPSTYPNEAFRSIVSRGWGLENPHVTKGFIAAAGWTLLSIVVVVLVERRKRK
ncbi:ABC transporter G family member 20 isoform X2 [Folsomia candida]|nr:ABC transporter G family member 20 isoform X2 [Folsomia candida]XP_035711580.1 ABC transporter G family member 20 isoform X2 [Folsomia candida]